MRFNIGDKVKFLNEKGEGVVTNIISKTTLGITIEDGLEIPYLVSELLFVEIEKNEKKEEFESKSETKNIQLPKKKLGKGPSTSKPHIKNNPAYEAEIDLHIENLVDRHLGMSNGEIVQVQLRYFQQALDNAIVNRYRKLVVIHGVGNGRLKEEVRQILAGYGGVRFYDASYAKYGFGATEILIY